MTGPVAINAPLLRGLGLKLFLAMVLLVAATLGGALALIRYRASQAADAAIDRGLVATQSSIEDALASRSQGLLQAARILGRVPTYLSRTEQALRAGDRSSLLDQAEEFREQGGAAWAMITDGAGVMQAFSRAPDVFGDTLSGGLIGSALSDSPAEGIWLEATSAGDSIFQAVAVPLTAPGGPVVGALVLALPVDGPFAERLKRQTASEVVFIVTDTLGIPQVATSTLPAGTLDSALRSEVAMVRTSSDSVPARLRVAAGGLTWIAATGPLLTASGEAVGEFAGLRALAAAAWPDA